MSEYIKDYEARILSLQGDDTLMISKSENKMELSTHLLMLKGEVE